MLNFRKKLQHEMLTQNIEGQAAPRFRAVKTTRRIYWVDDEIDGYEVVIEEEIAGETVKDILAYIKEYHADFCEEFPNIILECEKCKDIKALCNILKKEG